MKKYILNIIMGMMLFMMTSCASAQVYSDYDAVVYYDYVVDGVIVGDRFVNDGVYSYHITSVIPSSGYWVLYPIYSSVKLYNRNMVYMRLYKPSSHWMFHHKKPHHRYNPPKPHYKPSNTYRPHRPTHKPGNTVRPPQNHRGGGHFSRPTRPTNRNHNSGGHRRR